MGDLGDCSGPGSGPTVSLHHGCGPQTELRKVGDIDQSLDPHAGGSGQADHATWAGSLPGFGMDGQHSAGEGCFNPGAGQEGAGFVKGGGGGGLPTLGEIAQGPQALFLGFEGGLGEGKRVQGEVRRRLAREAMVDLCLQSLKGLGGDFEGLIQICPLVGACFPGQKVGRLEVGQLAREDLLFSGAAGLAETFPEAGPLRFLGGQEKGFQTDHPVPRMAGAGGGGLRRLEAGMVEGGGGGVALPIVDHLPGLGEGEAALFAGEGGGEEEFLAGGPFRLQESMGPGEGGLCRLGSARGGEQGPGLNRFARADPD